MSQVYIYKMNASKKGAYVAVIGEAADGAQCLGVSNGGDKTPEKTLADLKADIKKAGEFVFMIYGGALSIEKFNADEPELVETLEL